MSATKPLPIKWDEEDGGPVWGKKKELANLPWRERIFPVERITFEMIRVAIERLASAGSELSFFWSKKVFMSPSP